MIDLAAIPDDVLTARGQYATVRAAHEDAKKQLAVMCGQFGSIAPQVLSLMQPRDDSAPDMRAVNELLESGRKLLETIAAHVSTIEGLVAQRAVLKDAAWGRP